MTYFENRHLYSFSLILPFRYFVSLSSKLLQKPAKFHFLCPLPWLSTSIYTPLTFSEFPIPSSSLPIFSFSLSPIFMESDALPTKKQSNVFRLKCSVQTYDWGIRGQDSLVARLFALNSGSLIDPDKPYAEFWMGTHDSGPSFLIPPAVENGGRIDSYSTSLKSWVLENPNVLGDKVVQKWGSDIPFLFKV